MSDKAETWQAALEGWQIREALHRYIAEHPEDVAGTRPFRDLLQVRSRLRGKRWASARNLIVEQRDEAGGSHAQIDWSHLEAEVVQLERSADHLDRRQPEEALRALEGLSHPLFEAERLTLEGTAYIFLDRAEQAEQSFVQALESDPEHYRALTNRGNIHLEAGRTDEAIDYYRRALELEPEFGNALHNLGVAYRRKGNIAKSVQTIRRAQRSIQREVNEEARGPGKRSNSKRGASLRWLIWAAIAIIAILWLRSNGII